MLKSLPKLPKHSISLKHSTSLLSSRYRRSSWKSNYSWQHNFSSQKSHYYALSSNYSTSVSKLLILIGCGVFLGAQNYAFADDESYEDESEEEQVNDDTSSAEEEATRIVKILKEKFGAPGIIAYLVHHGKVVYAHAEGYSDVENLVPARVDTPMRIASISKTLTAVTLMKLVEQGKIDLDAPVQKYIPNFPEKPEGTITVRHLASHVSGIRHYADAQEFQSKVNYSTIQDAIKVFEKDPIKFSPGSSFLYSTFGYTVLSQVIESATGKPFLQVVQQEVLRPLRMNDTFPDVSSKIVPRRSQYYYRTKKGDAYNLVNAPWVDNSNKWAGGGFVSTASNIAALGYELLHPTLLRPETVQQMMTPQPNAISKKLHHYGLGLHAYHVKKHPKFSKSATIWGHSGGACGGTTQLVVLPEDDLVVVMMANLGNAPSLMPSSVKLAEVFLKASHRGQSKEK